MNMMLKQKRFKITIISFLVVTLLVVSFTYMKQKVVTDAKSATKAEIIKNTELHVLNAEEHPDITLDGALIMIMPDMEVFVGGDVVFRNELLDVKYMKISYYYIEDGEAIPLRVNVFTTEGSEHGMSFKKQDMGTERGENLISTKKVALFNDILRFSAEGTFMNGERFEYTTKVNVKKVY